MNQSIIIRKTFGLSQKELSDILNVSSNRLLQFENETAVLPLESNQKLNLLYRYMKLALSYKLDLKTIADYVAERKAVEKQLKENKKQRDQISAQLEKAVLRNKEELAKKRLLWLLTQSKTNNFLFCDQKLEDCLRKQSDLQEADAMNYKIKLSVLNFEKGKLVSMWRQIQSEIEFLECNPIS